MEPSSKRQNPTPGTQPADVEIVPMGTIATLRPITEIGERWIAANCSIDQWQWFSGALAVEPKYIGNIANAMRKAGLRVKFGS